MKGLQLIELQYDGFNFSRFFLYAISFFLFLLSSLSCQQKEVQTALVLEIKLGTNTGDAPGQDQASPENPGQNDYPRANLSAHDIKCITIVVIPQNGSTSSINVKTSENNPDNAASSDNVLSRVAVYPGKFRSRSIHVGVFGRLNDCSGEIAATLEGNHLVKIHFVPEQALVHEMIIVENRLDEIPDYDDACLDDDPAGRPDHCPCHDGETKTCFTLAPKEMADVGICRSGTRTCVRGEWGPCRGQQGPEPEICDGRDNSCDGVIDSPWLLPWIPCEDEHGEPALGVCAMVAKPCIDGELHECTPDYYEEVLGDIYSRGEDYCYGLDNNCDGKVDYGCPCFPAEDPPRQCYTYGTGMNDPTLNVGRCVPGIQHCEASPDGSGQPGWGDCIGEVVPQPEVCDNFDRSCTGDPHEHIEGIGSFCEAEDALGICRDGRFACDPSRTHESGHPLGLICKPGDPLPPHPCGEHDGRDGTCTQMTDDEIGICPEGWRCCTKECRPPTSINHCGACYNNCNQPLNECKRPVCRNNQCADEPRQNGIPCTSGGYVCREGQCLSQCFIGNVFFNNNDLNPHNECLVCKPDHDAFEWSDADDGTTCTNGICREGLCRNNCTLPWGGTIRDGESVTAYRDSTVDCGADCKSQTRRCNNGTLTGHYTNRDCSSPCATCPGGDRDWGDHNCSGTLPGNTQHDEQHTINNTVQGRSGSATFKCNNGTWQLQDGSECNPDSCSGPGGQPVLHNTSITAYENTSVPCGETCKSQQRTCSYGILSGSYAHTECTVEDCASCALPWGGTIDHGDSVHAYETGSVACGESCPSPIVRTCQNGNLTGSGNHEECSPLCNNCDAGTVSWGSHNCSADISMAEHGISIDVTNDVEGRDGQATFVCDNGVWSRSGTGTCTANSCENPFGGNDILHNGTIEAYQQPQAPCGQTCVSETRQCSYGTLSGSYMYESCSVQGECIPSETQDCTTPEGIPGIRTCSGNCEWGSCVATGVCVPGNQQNCGNCGTQICDSDGNWGECAGEGPCAEGETRDCTAAGGIPGEQICTAECQWGTCEPIGDCAPNDTRDCGNCGTQTCDSYGNWGECAGEGACEPEATDSQDCGNCGTQTRTCSSSCQWSSWSNCTGQGPCAPETTQVCNVGGIPGTQICTSTCEWGTCETDGVCVPNDEQVCGNCGTQICDSDGNWGSCTGQGPCAEGQTQECTAAGDIPGEKICTAECQWGACEPDCVPDTCSSLGFECDSHPDGCGGTISCGSCDPGFTCDNGQCVPTGPNCPADKDCSGLDCGPDPVCGESCGSCSGDEECIDGQCVSTGPDCPADKDCSGLDCGPDPVCGLSCGSCPVDEECFEGACYEYIPD